MGLSNELVSKFVKVTKDNVEVKKETTVYGTIVEYNGSKYVKLDGSDLLTPYSSTTDVEPNERVTVMIKNHTAIVTGNVSSPAARTDTVKEVANKITEYEIIIAHKVVAKDIEATNARIDTLKTTLAKITTLSASELAAVNASIESIRSKIITADHLTATDIEAIDADIENLRSTFGTFESLTTDDLEAINADINYLKTYSGDFTYVSTNVLKAIKADIQELNTKKLSATDAAITYANIDFSNIGKAAIQYFYATSGLIKDVVVGDGTITGELVGVTIKGDLIEGGTVKADKLVIKGTDGLYYKLNTDGIKTETEQTEYNSINGSIILAKSITASKINVKDLVAFDATIGGFNITDSAIYSGTKSSIDNTTNGIYLDKNGQIVFGNSNNYVKFYKDSEGNYKLAISADSISLGSSKTIEETISEMQEKVDKMSDEVATVLRIDSSRGTVFKNNAVSTVLSAVVYRGSKRITNITDLKTEYGSSAHLEWKWQKMDETSFGTILSTDSRLGNDGFTFTLSPEDVDTKVVFMCQLITD